MDTRRQFKLMCFGLSSRHKSIIVALHWKCFVTALCSCIRAFVFITGNSLFAERLEQRVNVYWFVNQKQIYYFTYLFTTTTYCLCIYMYITLIQQHLFAENEECGFPRNDVHIRHVHELDRRRPFSLAGSREYSLFILRWWYMLKCPEQPQKSPFVIFKN